jgi:hypothetical protein
VGHLPTFTAVYHSALSHLMHISVVSLPLLLFLCLIHGCCFLELKRKYLKIMKLVSSCVLTLEKDSERG